MAQGSLSEIRLDEEIWRSGSPERRLEWRAAIDEILQEGKFEFAGEVTGAKAVLTVRKTEILLAMSAHGSEPTTCTLALDQLGPYLTDYIDTCLEMTRLSVGTRSPRLEALDIAKRLVHDEAGETVRSMVKSPRPDHATARRLFTLIVTLIYDTTRLTARPHLRPT